MWVAELRRTEVPQRHALNGGALSGEGSGLKPTPVSAPSSPSAPGHCTCQVSVPSAAPWKPALRGPGSVCRVLRHWPGSPRAAACLAEGGQGPCRCQAAARQVASLQSPILTQHGLTFPGATHPHRLLQWGQGGQAAGETLILGQGRPLCPLLQREAGLPSSQLCCRPQSRQDSAQRVALPSTQWLQEGVSSPWQEGYKGRDVEEIQL